MNRAQFMEQLKRLLSDISEAERNEALDYYESYFDDAGAENEASVIRELGSPGKVAAIIKADLKESNDSYAEYTERGYEDSRTREPGQMPQTRRNRAERGYRAEKMRSSRLILAVILLVFLSPFIIGAAGGALGVIAVIALLPFILVFAAGAGGLALVIGAIVCVVMGIGLCGATPAAGMLTIGVGCLLLALGILFCVLAVWLVGRVLPKLLRKVTDFCYSLLHREKKEAGV